MYFLRLWAILAVIKIKKSSGRIKIYSNSRFAPKWHKDNKNDVARKVEKKLAAYFLQLSAIRVGAAI